MYLCILYLSPKSKINGLSANVGISVETPKSPEEAMLKQITNHKVQTKQNDTQLMMYTF